MTATGDLPFACACGQVAGTIANASPKRGDYVVCHCTDCQSLPLYLGCAERVLDEHGGIAIYQARIGDISIDQGADKLAALHLTDQPTLRWYAGCCDTPLFNSYANGRIPFTSTLLANCGTAVDAVLGKPRGHLFVKDALGDTGDLKTLSMARVMPRVIVRMAKDILSGARRRNPLFDPGTFAPIAAPRRLNPAERAEVKGLVDNYHERHDETVP